MASLKSVIVLLAVVAVAAAVEDAPRDKRGLLLSGVAPLPQWQSRAGIISPLVPGLTPIGHGLAAPGLVAPGLVAPGLVAPGLVAPGLVAPGLVGRGLAGHGLAGPGLVAPGLVGHGLVNPWVW